MDRKKFDEQLDELRRVRDELRLQAHLGQMEAGDAWEALEDQWHELERRVGAVAEEGLESAEEALKDLRVAYDGVRARARKAVAEARDYTLWERTRNTYDALVESGYEVTGRLADSIEELGDAAKLRVDRARLERSLLRKCAELGTRVHRLAMQPAAPDGSSVPVLEDEKVRPLVAEVSELRAELEKTEREILERD